MICTELTGRAGDDCYSAWLVWRDLPDRIESEGVAYFKYPLDVARDGFRAVYRRAQPRPVRLYESCGV